MSQVLLFDKPTQTRIELSKRYLLGDFMGLLGNILYYTSTDKRKKSAQVSELFDRKIAIQKYEIKFMSQVLVNGFREMCLLQEVLAIYLTLLSV